MITYLKNTGGYKYSQLKGKKTLARKRAGEKKSKESAKKQKLKDVTEEQELAKSDEEAAANYEHEKEELRIWLTVVSDEEETIGILQASGELWKIWSKISKDEDLLKRIKITEDIS
ncbi:hypothetical protein Tco_1132527 [Tanacetum coccineum]|uniref:Uncharacterized protein n=1 Tax=Tanacetum coccineum TaxID=301880 RepID=A0ABQ5JD86_9ASTR